MNLSPGQPPRLIKSTLTWSSGNRFTTTYGCNIPNGSSQMANLPCVILTRRASWNCSLVKREENPPSPLLILIGFSNREQTDSTHQLIIAEVARRYFAAFFSPWRAGASREGCLASARRSVFFRRFARFLALSLPRLCPINVNLPLIVVP
jgi:hypothetical protein